ncbi:pyrroline-5-carboxylate reductase [Azonexus sp.]|uniref:pyrroline-5-carboxylate reductase n=1 Tax=Azonexus sp. TaxID=1872668 RepID=UPI0039E616AC
MKLLFLGGGNMAYALIGGLLKTGLSAGDIHVVDPVAEVRLRLQAQFGVACFACAEETAETPDVVLLAVKPQQMQGALAPWRSRLGDSLVISIAAGIDLATLSRWLDGHQRLVRVMPNTPALVGAGISGCCATPAVDAAARALTDRLLQSVGATLWVADEKHIDAVTAISGSGPAYVFLFIEALQHAAQELGLTPEQGRQLALATVQGAGALAAASDESVSVLRERVTSKGGTTAAALEVMRAREVPQGIIAGCHAAAARSEELGRLLGAV